MYEWWPSLHSCAIPCAWHPEMKCGSCFKQVRGGFVYVGWGGQGAIGTLAIILAGVCNCLCQRSHMAWLGFCHCHMTLLASLATTTHPLHFVGLLGTPHAHTIWFASASPSSVLISQAHFCCLFSHIAHDLSRCTRLLTLHTTCHAAQVL